MPVVICAHAGCGKALTPPLMQCSKCKSKAYCSKECQVCNLATTKALGDTHRLTRTRFLTVFDFSNLPHQIAAWKGGHKHECDAKRSQGVAAEKLKRAARGVTVQVGAARSCTLLTAPQRDLVKKLFELEDAGDWLGVVALKSEAMAVAAALRETQPGLAGRMHNVLGVGFESTGDYASACEVYEQHRSISTAKADLAGVARACANVGLCYHRMGNYAEAIQLHEECRETCSKLADSEWEARACGNLGNCYFSIGDYRRARELHELHRKMAQEQGDQVGVATACGNLGMSYYRMGNYAQARKLHEEHRATAEAVGDRPGVARACSNIASCYLNIGDYSQAQKLHEQSRAMAEELGDRAGVAMALDNLGLSYQGTGDYVRAREVHEASKAIYQKNRDRPGLARTFGNIAKCCLNTGDYGQAISYFTQNYEMAKEMQVEAEQAEAALGIGIASMQKVRENSRGPECEQSAPSPCASACYDDGARKAEKWLQTALHLGYRPARLHLARLALDVGAEDSALQYLHKYLACCVEQGRNHCEGCCQTRGDDAQMLTCGGCRVARFCSTEHQKMASKRIAEGGSLLQGRHRDVCSLLCKWRQEVVKGGKSPAVLRTDLLAFLRI